MLPEFRQVSTQEALRRLMGTIQETTEESRPPPPFEEKNIICVHGNRTLCVRVQSTLSVFLLDVASPPLLSLNEVEVQVAPKLPISTLLAK
jgi:hypothetical protein